MSSPPARRPLGVLLVEDNPGDARLLQELLREGTLRYELHRAERLRQGRELAAGGVMDIVLLDLSLPDAHGIETVRQMLDAAGDTPIVVLTGLDDEGVALQAVQAGAQDYLVKGQVDSAALGRAIRYAIERKRLELERVQLLRRAEEARATAEAAVRARDEVLRVVSHDLGNSLSAVSIQAVLLERTPSDQRDDEGVRRRTSAIRNLVSGMQQLRQDLLDVASIEAGRLSIEPVPTEAASLVEEAIDLHRDLALEKGVSIESRIGDASLRVLADRGRLLQVLGNLLGNAVKFTGQGGSVEVAAEAAADGVRFSVRDTGVGVAADDLPHIFDRFWKARRGNRQGAGLGLAIARGIVEAHGGRMWADSEVGVGSTFCFVLPRPN